MTRMTSDIEKLQQLLQDGLAQFAIQGLTMVVVTVILFFYNVELALHHAAPDRARPHRAVAVVPRGLRHGATTGSATASPTCSPTCPRACHGVRVVTAYNRQRHNVLHHRNVVGALPRRQRLHRAHQRRSTAPAPSSSGCSARPRCCSSAATWCRDGTLSIGELAAFFLYLNSFFAPIQQLVQQYNTYQQGQAAIVKLDELLATHPTVEESEDAGAAAADRGRDHARARVVRLRPGQPGACTTSTSTSPRARRSRSSARPARASRRSPSWSPASTTRPRAGSLIDGHDLRDVTIESLRRQLGVVPQEPFLFAGTIRDNIAFARPDATDDEVERGDRTASGSPT